MSTPSVAGLTALLVERAMEGARATEGRYDPTVGGALLAQGYDRTFGEVPGRTRNLTTPPVIDGSWPAIEVDHERCTVCLPEGTIFDIQPFVSADRRSGSSWLARSLT